MRPSLRRFLLCLCVALGLPAAGASAWSDHASLVWPLLQTLPALQQPDLRVEPLENFLRDEAAALEKLLSVHEERSRATLAHYAPRPDGIAFRADAADLRAAFLAAIRVNPTLPYGLYRQSMVGEAAVPEGRAGAHGDLSFLASGVVADATVYERLEPGAAVSPAQVLASASDEPDFGMDIGLFSDNATTFGAGYGFGNQPFGNPNLDYSSQAPFHMGFYNLDWLTRRAQPDLLRTFPEWRVSLYRALATHAFDSGHDYWGWRFMGWALHYIGDMSQPYHTEPLPGISTAEALWTVLTGGTEAAVQRVSNRHGVLESYQYQRVQAALRAAEPGSLILTAIASAPAVPVFTARTLRHELALESVAAAAELDDVLGQYVPARYVSDPAFEWTGSGEEASIVARVRAHGGDAAIAALDSTLSVQLRRFGRYARAWIELAMEHAGTP